MDTPRGSPEVAIAIVAKAPIPHLSKTRLTPALGAEGAATLQARLLAQAVATAAAADVGPVTVWCAPDSAHPAFQALADEHPVTLRPQPEGDLGVRMLTAIVSQNVPTLVTGTDCPFLTAAHLRRAAAILRAGIDAVVAPAEDGGYVLIGLRRPCPALFAGIAWSTATVMAETRLRLAQAGLSWREPFRLRDIDVPADLAYLPADLREA